MVYSFARIGAALAMKVEDVYVQNRRLWVRLHEKGGSIRRPAAARARLVEPGMGRGLVLAEPLGPGFRPILGFMIEVPGAVLIRQRLRRNHGPQPTLPQDEDVPCCAKAAPDKSARTVTRAMIATRMRMASSFKDGWGEAVDSPAALIWALYGDAPCPFGRPFLSLRAPLTLELDQPQDHVAVALTPQATSSHKKFGPGHLLAASARTSEWFASASRRGC